MKLETKLKNNTNLEEGAGVHTLCCDENGVAIIEFALVLPVLFLLFAIMVDLSILFRERAVLFEAGQIAIRTIAVAPPCQVCSYSNRTGCVPCTGSFLESYATIRFQKGLSAAKSVISSNGLDSNFYSYRLTTTESTEPVSNVSQRGVRFRINSRDDAQRFVLIPEGFSASRLCHEVSGFVEGPVRDIDNPLFDPSIDTSCDPIEVQ